MPGPAYDHDEDILSNQIIYLSLNSQFTIMIASLLIECSWYEDMCSSFSFSALTEMGLLRMLSFSLFSVMTLINPCASL